MSQPQSRWQMPAEWAQQRRTYVAWPCRDAIWSLGVDAAKQAFAEVIDAISQFQPVTLLVRPQQLAEAQQRVPAHNVTLLPLALDDSWARDILPLFVTHPELGLGAVDFAFNAWGEKFNPYHNDAAAGQALLQALAQQQPLQWQTEAMVFEGGAIHSNGQGTLLTTAECLLHPNRNPNLNQAEIEQRLLTRLGGDKLLWLPKGLHGDVDTDGHVDNIATFTAPGKLLSMHCDDRQHPNFERYQANAAYLSNQIDAHGQPLQLTTIPQPQDVSLDGEPLALSYINYYLGNDVVVVPAFGQNDHDQEAAQIIQAQFPTREVVAIDAMPILAGGGGIHCITMQEPS
ncbi:agmatine deiminase family protein [uncultured Ferrimonas sp.]|uniref:agmatine deiminase family protein n=1 Tax=uncultured Ferrimonas sp. TaxID=432640 RepID=UPI00261FB83B|nr:agmatine deiminase family protein [uncultured Ferrimonas sp.]